MVEPNTNEASFWLGLGAFVVAMLTATREWWGEIRRGRGEVRRDEILFLQREVDGLKEANELCERRCEELREDVMNLLAHIHDIKEPPKRKRKTAAQ